MLDCRTGNTTPRLYIQGRQFTRRKGKYLFSLLSFTEVLFCRYNAPCGQQWKPSWHRSPLAKHCQPRDSDRIVPTPRWMFILSTHRNCPQGQIMLERWLEGTEAESSFLENQVLYYSLLWVLISSVLYSIHVSYLEIQTLYIIITGLCLFRNPFKNFTKGNFRHN